MCGSQRHNLALDIVHHAACQEPCPGATAATAPAALPGLHNVFVSPMHALLGMICIMQCLLMLSA